MVLDARDRSEIYKKLTPTLGEHHANLLMSEFPSIEADELVTKQFLRAELAEVRVEIGGVRTDMASMEARINERFREQTMWMAGALVAGIGMATGIATGVATLLG